MNSVVWSQSLHVPVVLAGLYYLRDIPKKMLGAAALVAIFPTAFMR